MGTSGSRPTGTKPQMGTVWAQVVYTALYHATTSGKCSIQCIHIATDASIQRSSLQMTHKTNVECNCVFDMQFKSYKSCFLCTYTWLA